MGILKIKDWKENQLPQFTVLRVNNNEIVSVRRIADSRVFLKDVILGQYIFHPTSLEGLLCFFVVKVQVVFFNYDCIHCNLFHSIHIPLKPGERKTEEADMGIMGWGGEMKINEIQINGDNGYLTDRAIEMLKLQVPLINHHGATQNLYDLKE